MQQHDEEEIQAIVEVLRRREEGGAGDELLRRIAREWLDAGFDDPEEVSAWLDVRCLTASGAQALEGAGFTPEQAALRTSAGSRPYEDTLGFKFVKGDLSLDEARRIITREFWNS